MTKAPWWLAGQTDCVTSCSLALPGEVPEQQLYGSIQGLGGTWE